MTFENVADIICESSLIQHPPRHSLNLASILHASKTYPAPFTSPILPLLPCLPSTAFLYCLGALFNPQPDLGIDGKTYLASRVCNYSRDIFCAGLDISPICLAKWRSWCRQFRASVRRRCKNEMVATKATSTESATCHRACTGNP